jgi:hypothetical protein
MLAEQLGYISSSQVYTTRIIKAILLIILALGFGLFETARAGFEENKNNKEKLLQNNLENLPGKKELTEEQKEAREEFIKNQEQQKCPVCGETFDCCDCDDPEEDGMDLDEYLAYLEEHGLEFDPDGCK